MRQKREEKETIEVENLKNKNLMRKASVYRQQEVVNRFD